MIFLFTGVYGIVVILVLNPFKCYSRITKSCCYKDASVVVTGKCKGYDYFVDFFLPGREIKTS